MFCLFIVAALPVVTNADLALQLLATKARVQRGEPTKVVLTWSAKQSVQVVTGTETLFLDDGTGYRPYSEASFSESALVRAPLTLAPGATLKTAYELGVEDLTDDPARVLMRFAFSMPGRYRIKVQYDEVVSNEVAIDVEAPTSDLDLVAQLQARPALLTLLVRAEPTLRSVLESLLASHSTSPYLARPRLLLAEARFGEAASADIKAGVAPSTGEARRVLEDLKALDLSATAFGEDHLLLIAKLSEEVYELDQVREAYEAVIERYPNGVAAVTAKEWLDENVADRTAPVLNVTASPASLWPPNHKLAPITVAVQVSDARDPSPTLKLVSITCDDACDPASDVLGAAYGTDDRQFEVRSERKGTSASGRTYTITYSAEDATGNKTTAETKVTIAHDQGKKK